MKASTLLALCQRNYSFCSICFFRPQDDKFSGTWKMGQNFLKAVLHETEKDPTKKAQKTPKNPNQSENKEIKEQSYKCMLWSFNSCHQWLNFIPVVLDYSRICLKCLNYYLAALYSDEVFTNMEIIYENKCSLHSIELYRK